MIERVIENWLDRASERSFQVPFCQMLAADGYTVVHLTRHCGMELGKDVLAIAPDGTPCAYQLKGAPGSKISLSQWRHGIGQQTFDLVVTAPVHPSLPIDKPHRAYLVTNGQIDEEVTRAIEDMNLKWQRQGQPQQRLETIVRGEMLRKAQALSTSLWPTELRDAKQFLELCLEDGRNLLPKKKLSSLLEATLPLGTDVAGKAPSAEACSRALASTALLCGIAIAGFTQAQNYVAEIEAWTLYLAYTLALVERRQLPARRWANEFAIAESAIYNAMALLCEELQERKHLVEGDAFTDQPFYRIRVTWLVAMMSIYGLWRRYRKEPANDTDEFLRRFIVRWAPKLDLWGEAAVPQLLAYMWFARKVDAGAGPDHLLNSIITAICNFNGRGKDIGLWSPYYEANDVMSYRLGHAEEPLEETFAGSSYTLEGLTHLYVRRNWKQRMKALWPDITRVDWMRLDFAEPWHFYKWRNDEGVQYEIQPPHTQDWEELKQQAQESEGTGIPPALKKHPHVALLFLTVYPHRSSATLLRWLDTQLKAV